MFSDANCVPKENKKKNRREHTNTRSFSARLGFEVHTYETLTNLILGAGSYLR